MKLVTAPESTDREAIKAARLPDWRYHLALWSIATLVMLPVLVRPQWGMFSDPGQILWTCGNVYSHGFHLDEWFNVVVADYRPGFHLINLLLWGVSANEPLGFYVAKWLCFGATISLTFVTCYRLSRSKLSSAIASLFWFCAYPTYEVIYTLDKGEIYIALLFALIPFAHLSVVDAINNGTVTRGVSHACGLGRGRNRGAFP